MEEEDEEEEEEAAEAVGVTGEVAVAEVVGERGDDKEVLEFVNDGEEDEEEEDAALVDDIDNAFMLPLCGGAGDDICLDECTILLPVLLLGLLPLLLLLP